MIRKTSIDAYHQIETAGLLSARRWELYKLLFHHGPLTCNELFRLYQGESSANNPNVHARLNELRESGCVAEVGERICSITGVNVILWDVTDLLPKKLTDKPPKKTELIRALCCRVEEMTDYLSTKDQLPEKWVIWRNQGHALLAQCAKYRTETKH